MQDVNHRVPYNFTESFDDDKVHDEWYIYEEAQEAIRDICLFFTYS